MNFKIIPHQGLGEIHFGMTRKEVRQILGKPYSSSESSIFQFEGTEIPRPATDGFFKKRASDRL